MNNFIYILFVYDYNYFIILYGEYTQLSISHTSILQIFSNDKNWSYANDGTGKLVYNDKDVVEKATTVGGTLME